MAVYGVTDLGFASKSYEEISAELKAELIAALGPDLNTTANSVMGQIIDIFSLKLTELWEVSIALYNDFDPDFATGDALDRLGLITGTPRLLATRSTVTATLNLDNGVTVPAGTTASVVGNTSSVFRTLTAITNSSGITANVDVEMEAVSTGPVAALAGTLTVIGNPVSGWNSITNAVDAVPGTNDETDAAYRLRRLIALPGLGTSPANAIRADLLAVEDVISVFLYVNDTDTTDVEGLLPHSIEALVYGGSDEDIANQIWESKAAGIGTNGSTTVVITDSSGASQSIKFSRPTTFLLYIDVSITTDPDLYPANGDALVAQSIADWADAHLFVGTDVTMTSLYGPIFEVPGVLDVTALYLYSSSVVGSESLNEPSFATNVDWSQTGDFSFTTDAVYAHSTGAGTITQLTTDMAIAPVVNRWYAFTYTVSGSTGATTANITSAFALTATALDLTNGTHTVYVHSGLVAGDFIISATSTSGGFTITTASLKLITRATVNFPITARQLANIDTSRITVISS